MVDRDASTAPNGETIFNTKNPRTASTKVLFGDFSIFGVDKAEEFEEKTERYPFDEYDDAFYDMKPLETYLKKFIRENINDF